MSKCARSNVATVEIEVVPDRFPWQNKLEPRDVNADGVISPIDVLFIINFLNFRLDHNLPVPPTPDFSPPPYLDVSGDNEVSPVDAVRVINFLNGEGEGEYVPAAPPAEVALEASDAEGEADGQLLSAGVVGSWVTTETPRAYDTVTDGPLSVGAVESAGASGIREGVAEDPHKAFQTSPRKAIADWDDLLDDIAEDIVGAQDDELISDLALNGLLRPQRDDS